MPQKERSNKKIIAFVVIAILLGGIIFILPKLIISFIENKYPFVKIQSAHITLQGLQFKNVQVDKPNIKATLHTVTVKRFTSPYLVHVVGGDIQSVFETQQSSSGNANSLADIHIFADDLNLSVKKDNIFAKLEGAGYKRNSEEDDVWFDSGIVEIDSRTIYVKNGAAPRNLSKIHIEQVDVDFELPFALPAVPSKSIIHAYDVTAHRKEKLVNISKLKYGIIEANNVRAGLVKGYVDISIDKGVDIKHPWMSDKELHFSGFNLQVNKNKPHLITLNSRVTIDIDLKKYSIKSSGNCNSWAYLFPFPRPEAIESSIGEYSGQLSFDVQIFPKPKLHLDNQCTFKCSSEPVKSLVNPDGFLYTAYNKDGEKFQRLSGPNTEDWVPLEKIAPEVMFAVITMEDPGFYSHNGILPLALQASLRENLRTGRFSRGGSTITMQLAKNLWLERDKTILRKGYEAMLTVALESCFTKERLLEYYLNIVEFGPDIYGIGSASEYYFDKEPIALTAEEAFYLAKILPNPTNAAKPEHGGIESAKRIMKKLSKIGFAL